MSLGCWGPTPQTDGPFNHQSPRLEAPALRRGDEKRAAPGAEPAKTELTMSPPGSPWLQPSGGMAATCTARRNGYNKHGTLPGTRFGGETCPPIKLGQLSASLWPLGAQCGQRSWQTLGRLDSSCDGPAQVGQRRKASERLVCEADTKSCDANLLGRKAWRAIRTPVL